MPPKLIAVTMNEATGWNCALCGIFGGWAVGGFTYYGGRRITAHVHPPIGLLRRMITRRCTRLGGSLGVLLGRDISSTWRLGLTVLGPLCYCP